MRARWANNLAAVCAAGLLLAACAETGSDVRSSGASPVQLKFHVGDPFPDQAGLALPVVAPISWHTCADKPAPWQCGELAVPLDYHRPLLDTVTLALTRLPATEQTRRIGSLVVNPGGPGGTGISLARSIAPTMPVEILSRFDLVGFDPRGVGQSDPLQCDLRSDPNNGYDPSIVRKCIRDNAMLLPQLGTVNVARDLEQIRQAVGDRQLTYLGYSYGTALGAVYATLFPGKVRAIVLDGSVNPTAGQANLEHRSDLPDFYGVQYFDRSRRRFLAECSLATTCPLGAHAATALDTLENSLGGEAVPATSLPGADSLTSDILQQDFFAGYYNSDYWPYLAQGIAEANAGDGSVLVAIAGKLAGQESAAAKSQESFANFAITCADFADRSGGCNGWPLTAEPMPALKPVQRQAPILVLGTDGDPATPVEQAKVMAKTMGNAVTVYWAGDGHTAFLRGSTCIDNIVSEYLVGLAIPQNALRCPESDSAHGGRDAADQLFSMGSRRRLDAYVRRAVVDGDSSEHATCMAGLYAGILTQSQLAHVFLGVPDRTVSLEIRLQLSTCS